MKKIQLSMFFIFSFVVTIQAQKLEPTSHIWLSGTADDFRGGYVFSYASAGTPWNGSLISYGGFTNNYDTQISSDYWRNRISFRTRNGDANFWNPWIELATKGANDFIGNQSIEGNLGIGTTDPSNIQGWSRVLDVAGIHDSKILATSENALYKVGIFSHNTNWYGGGGFVGTESNHSLHLITNYNVKMSLLTNGNVGIGELNPKNKLDVNGIIHSKEVKVDMEGWSDFVFKKEYNLPTLEEVEKHIAEKGHLENIPSEKEVLQNGINLGEMNAKLLQKIEELTLYMIEMKKDNENMKNDIVKLKQRE
ncbi:hypothetical protein L0669_04220 [Flavobacterium bizetiae]|uniref:hypothetical protein n=1 Tax=Flavobacterium bizetiae TaxID=2704140 RepID=UPI0021E98EB5|nr:hypothetical protein [Flavobacterium bizetiae]UTN05113.1 hypothetical protein L0669_04220 [Flavobacterium bizetiae]